MNVRDMAAILYFLVCTSYSAVNNKASENTQQSTHSPKDIILEFNKDIQQSIILSPSKKINKNQSPTTRQRNKTISQKYLDTQPDKVRKTLLNTEQAPTSITNIHNQFVNKNNKIQPIILPPYDKNQKLTLLQQYTHISNSTAANNNPHNQEINHLIKKANDYHQKNIALLREKSELETELQLKKLSIEKYKAKIWKNKIFLCYFAGTTACLAIAMGILVKNSLLCL